MPYFFGIDLGYVNMEISNRKVFEGPGLLFSLFLLISRGTNTLDVVSLFLMSNFVLQRIQTVV